MPLTIPMRAQVSWTEAINGHVNRAVQSVVKPREAPATAYVPMPEGSSSDAPVTSPGPSTFRKRLIGFLSSIMAASREPVPPAGSECGITGAPLSDANPDCSLWDITATPLRTPGFAQWYWQ